MPVTHDPPPHYLENALDVLLRCKQVVNDMEYHVCVCRAGEGLGLLALANGARQQLNLDHKPFSWQWCAGRLAAFSSICGSMGSL